MFKRGTLPLDKLEKDEAVYAPLFKQITPRREIPIKTIHPKTVYRYPLEKCFGNGYVTIETNFDMKTSGSKTPQNTKRG